MNKRKWKPNGCEACWIGHVWNLIPWVRHTCPKGRRIQDGKTDEQLRPRR